MAFPKIKLCWNGSRVEADWHLGLFGFYTRGTHGSRLRGIVITLRGVLAWLAGLAFVAYFTGALALWLWLDRRPYNYVTYADLIFPTRWSEIEKLRGKAMIDEGMDVINARKWGAGLQKLRIGISRYPEEIKGRQTVAEIFMAMKASKQAIEMYDGGLATRYPGRAYVEAMIKAAAQSENYTWWLRTCDRALELVANDPEQAAERRWLIQQKLSALVAADRTDEALALADAEGETGSPSIKELRVLALLKAGRANDALDFLQEWDAGVGDRSDPQVLRLQVRAFREAGNLGEMEKALEKLRSLAPTDPRPYVYGIVQRILAGRTADANDGLDRFLMRFGSTPQHLLMLAAPLAEIGEPDMLGQLIDHATQQGFELETLQRFLVQARLGKNDWRGAATALGQITEVKKNEAGLAWYELMSAQIQAALDPGEGAQSNLVSLVRGRSFTLSFYKELIANLRRAGRPSTARQVITFAQGVYPQNADIETWRKELDSELAAAQASTPAIVLHRTNPETPVATDIKLPVRTEQTEADFDTRLAEFNKGGDFSGALGLIREARLAKPVWLAPRDTELMRQELRLSGRAGDAFALRTYARRYINGDRPRSVHAVEIARELQAAGRTDEAILLLKELLAKVPDFPVAARLLAEWSPKPPIPAQ